MYFIAKKKTTLTFKSIHAGYNQKFRTEILDSGLKAFNKMIEDDRNGVKQLFRSRDWNAEERQMAL